MSAIAPAPAQPADYLEGLLEGFLAYDADWRLTYANAAAARILRRKRADILGKRFAEIAPHLKGTLIEQNYQRVMRERVPVSFEVFHDHYGRWFELSVTPLSNGGVAVCFRDIDERKRAEAALRGSESELDDFFQNAAVGLHWVGPDGTILRVNRAELQMLGYGPEEYLGRNIAEFHADERTIHDILRCLASGQTLHNREARLRCKDGSLKDVLISSNVLWEGERFVHTRCFTRDVTELKQAERALRAREESLREADRRKDEFLATLAHELRNPLAPIRHGLHVLRVMDRNSEAAEQTRAIMERQTNHLVRLVDDLLEVSRVSRGKIDLRKEPVGLADVVGNAVETSRPFIEAAGHRLRIDLPADAIGLLGDNVRLAQVLSNLLNNAAKYTENGGDIELSAAREGETAVISVRDNGIGIPREMLPRVFDMFAQVDPERGRAQGGLGIGLALARTLVHLHGGAIEARSEGPGHGSEFIVRLPIARSRQAEARAAETWSLRCSKGPRRILVVDDNVDAAQSLSLMLRHGGHEVQVTHDGLAGLEAARGNPPDVILLDISMPGIDGLGVAQRLRLDPRFKPVRIVAVTGLGQEEDRRKSRAAGFDEHLVKPISPEVLREVLERS
jgi:PAS domain S-box-containing protein